MGASHISEEHSATTKTSMGPVHVSVRVAFICAITRSCRAHEHVNADTTCSQAGVGRDSMRIEVQFLRGSGGVPAGFQRGSKPV